MSIPLQIALVRDRAPRRGARRPLLLVAGVAAAVVASALAGGAPAVAARAPLPFGGGAAAVVQTVAATSLTLSSVRSALTALPNHDQIRIDQVLKNLATGAMD